MVGPDTDGATQGITAFPSEQVYGTNQTNEEFCSSAEQVIRRGQDLVRRAVNYATDYSVRSLTYFRRFYLTYRDDRISQTVFAKLESSTNLQIACTGRKTFRRWSHHLRLMRVPALQVEAAKEVS